MTRVEELIVVTGKSEKVTNFKRSNMVKIVNSFILILTSCLTYANSKSLVFPISTTINKALLSEYNVSTHLSRDDIRLIYSHEDKNFKAESIVVSNKSNIPIDEELDFVYRYSFNEISSSCKIMGSEVTSNIDFISVYLNGVKHTSNDVSDSISFDSYDYDNNMYKEDIIEIVPTGVLLGESPLYCEGEVNFIVELYL